MPRIARLVVPEYPHHITQRGNYRQDIFKDDADRRQYIFFIADYSRKYRLDILAYCLMNNHIHFIVMPKDEKSLGDTFRIVHTRYAQYFNKKMRSTGHLWHGRYYSCVLDGRHLLAAARYVERNPVRVKAVNKPTDYVWSSAKSHSAIPTNDIINASSLFTYVEIEQSRWRAFIDKSDEPDEVSVIRKYTMTGRPLGNTAFIQKLEKRFGGRLHALSVGRPKNAGNGK